MFDLEQCAFEEDNMHFPPPLLWACNKKDSSAPCYQGEPLSTAFLKDLPATSLMLLLRGRSASRSPSSDSAVHFCNVRGNEGGCGPASSTAHAIKHYSRGPSHALCATPSPPPLQQRAPGWPQDRLVRDVFMHDREQQQIEHGNATASIRDAVSTEPLWQQALPVLVMPTSPHSTNPTPPGSPICVNRRLYSAAAAAAAVVTVIPATETTSSSKRRRFDNVAVSRRSSSDHCGEGDNAAESAMEASAGSSPQLIRRGGREKKSRDAMAVEAAATAAADTMAANAKAAAGAAAATLPAKAANAELATASAAPTPTGTIDRGGNRRPPRRQAALAAQAARLGLDRREGQSGDVFEAAVAGPAAAAGSDEGASTDPVFVGEGGDGTGPAGGADEDSSSECGEEAAAQYGLDKALWQIVERGQLCGHEGCQYHCSRRNTSFRRHFHAKCGCIHRQGKREGLRFHTHQREKAYKHQRMHRQQRNHHLLDDKRCAP